MRIGILGGAKTGAAAARRFARAGHQVGINDRALTRRGALDPVREGSN
jgi:2-polyprenyl-6-methoxyphenol hydroxylase-like FAD-dependent oxidoreductase